MVLFQNFAGTTQPHTSQVPTNQKVVFHMSFRQVCKNHVKSIKEFLSFRVLNFTLSYANERLTSKGQRYFGPCKRCRFPLFEPCWTMGIHPCKHGPTMQGSKDPLRFQDHKLLSKVWWLCIARRYFLALNQCLLWDRVVRPCGRLQDVFDQEWEWASIAGEKALHVLQTPEVIPVTEAWRFTCNAVQALVCACVLVHVLYIICIHFYISV